MARIWESLLIRKEIFEHRTGAHACIYLDQVSGKNLATGWRHGPIRCLSIFLTISYSSWDALQTAEAEVQATLGQDDPITAHERLQIAAEQAGQELFGTLQQVHIVSVTREEERGMVAFTSRRKPFWLRGLT
jgi:hypothetical protein